MIQAKCAVLKKTHFGFAFALEHDVRSCLDLIHNVSLIDIFRGYSALNSKFFIQS